MSDINNITNTSIYEMPNMWWAQYVFRKPKTNCIESFNKQVDIRAKAGENKSTSLSVKAELNESGQLKCITFLKCRDTSPSFYNVENKFLPITNTDKKEICSFLDAVTVQRVTQKDLEHLVSRASEKTSKWTINTKKRYVSFASDTQSYNIPIKTIIEYLEISYTYLEILYNEDFWVANNSYLKEEYKEPILFLFSFVNPANYENYPELKKDADKRSAKSIANDDVLEDLKNNQTTEKSKNSDDLLLLIKEGVPYKVSSELPIKVMAELLNYPNAFWTQTAIEKLNKFGQTDTVKQVLEKLRNFGFKSVETPFGYHNFESEYFSLLKTSIEQGDSKKAKELLVIYYQPFSVELIRFLINPSSYFDRSIVNELLIGVLQIAPPPFASFEKDLFAKFVEFLSKQGSNSIAILTNKYGEVYNSLKTTKILLEQLPTLDKKLDNNIRTCAQKTFENYIKAGIQKEYNVADVISLEIVPNTFEKAYSLNEILFNKAITRLHEIETDVYSWIDNLSSIICFLEKTNCCYETPADFEDYVLNFIKANEKTFNEIDIPYGETQLTLYYFKKKIQEMLQKIH